MKKDGHTCVGPNLIDTFLSQEYGKNIVKSNKKWAFGKFIIKNRIFGILLQHLQMADIFEIYMV